MYGGGDAGSRTRVREGKPASVYMLICRVESHFRGSRTAQRPEARLLISRANYTTNSCRQPGISVALKTAAGQAAGRTERLLGSHSVIVRVAFYN